ncbi:uncharacterized protein LOC129968522 isoform X2 [Argiope bruennichi]|uniref:uncharacterized protein LOC129968522 isoform X2 n=1 Tax=Argiope bruennichi TaxID=94029 RepID=UPI0024952EA3|nr:uncharacterized protein LOC129968522 isoform X2 [Argiope bruennichi]
MSQYPNMPPRGILRNSNHNSNRQASSQSNSTHGSDEVYSYEGSTRYLSNPSNMSIYGEDLMQQNNSKSLNINANLYAQALAAKSSLGLLDVGNNSSQETQRSYDTHHPSYQSPLISSDKTHPRFSQQSKSGFQQNSDHRSSYLDELEEEDLFTSKHSDASRNSGPDQSVAFKPITDFNLNSVEDEDAFLYGDSDLPEKKSFQNEITKKVRSMTYGDDDLLDTETSQFDKYKKSKSKESNDDGEEPGIKLSISTVKKRPSWNNYSDDPISDNIYSKQELSFSFKQHKESYDAYSSSPSKLKEKSYEPRSYLHHNLDNDSRSSISFKTSKENSLHFSESNSPAIKRSNSSLNQSASVNNISYDDKFYSEYDELPQNERRVIYDIEKRSMDKSLSSESSKFPKLLINVKQGESSPSKRVVQVKESRLPSSKYTAKENSLISTRNLNKSSDLEIDKDVYETGDLRSRRAIHEKAKKGQELVNTSFKDEVRILPKRYSESSYKKSDDSYMEERFNERLLRRHSERYHFFKEGMESYSEYRLRTKSYKLRSPDRHWSPSYSPRHKSPSDSPRLRSPEYYRRRSPSYSPPNSHSRYRSPSYHYRGYSPNYRSFDPRRRSPERSSRRERRSHERSPHGQSKYYSLGKGSSWSVAEKESRFSHDVSPVPSHESKRKEKIVLKRGRCYTSEEKSDDEQEHSIIELTDKFKGKEPSVILKENESEKFNIIPAKKGKMSILDENKEEIFQKSQHPDAETKINHGIGIAKNTSDIFVQNEKRQEIAQDLTDSKDKHSEMMNSLLTSLGISSSQFSSSANTVITTVAPTTPWTSGSTTTLASVSTAPQQLNLPNVHQYGMHYPQRLSSAPLQMYPPYMYGISTVPNVLAPVSHFPPYNPLIPPPISPTSAYNYRPPALSSSNAFSSTNFQSNMRTANPNSKGRISCLKSVPVVNSDSSDTSGHQPSPIKNQNNSSSPAKDKMTDLSSKSVKSVYSKNTVLDTSNSSIETEQNMVERYKKVLEEKKILQKKLKNTSDHTIDIRNLMAELENKLKLSKRAAEKQLIVKCSSLYERANEELKRYIDEAKQVNFQLKELQTKIKPETLEKITKEVPEKKSVLPLPVKYTGFDTGGHWCDSCLQLYPTLPKMLEHLYSEEHTKHIDPSKVIAKEPPKENFDSKDYKLLPVKGVEFIKPLYAFYCSLCKETLPNQSYAEYHLKGNSHIEKCLTFLKENPIYENKREIFKEAAIISLATEKRQKELEQAKKRFIQEKQSNDSNQLILLKRQDILRMKQNKVQQQFKENDKELEEYNLSAQNSPQNLKNGIKLTLTNEKSKTVEPLESAATKVSEVKPKPKVVYIGRAPNYKPRSKGINKKSSVHSEMKNASLNADNFIKDEEGNNSPNMSSKDEYIATDFATLPADDNIKMIKNRLALPPKNHGKNKTASPKKNKNIPSCQSEAEAKESENIGCDSDKQSIRSEKTADNSEINQAIKNFIRSRKNATPLKGDHLLSVKPSELPSNIPPPQESMSSHKVSSPLQREQSLTEEEKDFLLLGISKSDMQPLAIPRPPPSNLIHNHSDNVSKIQSFPPPIQVPPPEITSKVPPPNIISQIPPPNIASQIPPPSITSNIPPPNLILQWSLEKNQQSCSALSNMSLSNHVNSSVSVQSSHMYDVDEDTGVVDMEIDNDLVCSEIKIGSDVCPTKSELSSLGDSVKKEFASSSSSGIELYNEDSMQQVSDSDLVSNEYDDRLILKNFLSSLMDAVSKKVVKDSKDRENSVESISGNLLPSTDKVIESDEKSSDDKFHFCPSGFEQSVSYSQFENNEKTNIVKNKNDVFSEITEQCSNDEVVCIYDTHLEGMQQNLSIENMPKKSQKIEGEEFSLDKKENVTLTSKTKGKLHDVMIDETNSFSLNAEEKTNNPFSKSVDIICDRKERNCGTDSSLKGQEICSSISISAPLKVTAKQNSVETLKTVCKSELLEPIQSIDSESQHHNKSISFEKMFEKKRNSYPNLNQIQTNSLSEIEKKGSPPSSPEIEIIEPDEKISRLEKFSYKQSAEAEEFDENVAESSNLTKDCASEKSENVNIKESIKEEKNMDEIKMTFPSEDSQSQPVPNLHKFDTDDIISNISTDGPPFLSEESTNKHIKEETEV